MTTERFSRARGGHRLEDRYVVGVPRRWSAGIVGPYVFVVWIGDFEGQGNPAFIGVDTAAPLFFRIADALNLARPDEAMPPLAPPPAS